MKNFLLLLLACFINSYFYAQDLRVSYYMQYKTDSTSSKYSEKMMLLDIHPNESRFYSYKLFKSDSTIIANSSLGRETASKSNDFSFMIIKDASTKKMKKYYNIFLDLYNVEESFPFYNWLITPDIKKILEFTCQKAVLNYKGRTWEAWFAKEIPINNGPSIFHGLPGLIISLKDTKDNYIFNLSKIENNIVNFYNENPQLFKSLSVTKKQLDKVLMDFYLDPYKEVKSKKLRMNFVDENGKEITPNFNDLTKYKQLQIKNNNNPIELSDAIIYE